MAIISRPNSPMLYMKFVFQTKQYLRSCKTTNRALAETRERQFRAKLEKDAYLESLLPEGEKEKRLAPAPAPTLAVFAALPTDDSPGGRFWADHASNEYAAKPNTLRFYRDRIKSLLTYERLAQARLDAIDESLIDAFVSMRRSVRCRPATINRDLSALKLVLGKARRWKLIRFLPEFPHFKEKRLGRVVTPEQEKIYLASVNEDQRDFVTLLIDTAIEPGPAAELAWGDVHLDHIGKFKFGFVHDRCAKTETHERDLPLSGRVAIALIERWLKQGRPSSGYVFPADRKGKSHPTPLSTFQSAHKRLWSKTAAHDPIALPKFRLYDLRHTALTRLRNSGADAHDLKQYAGWSSSRMADRYIHADDDSKARAADRFNAHIEAEQARVAKD